MVAVLMVGASALALGQGRQPPESSTGENPPVRTSTGASANPNAAYRPPQFESADKREKEWHAYNQRFKRDLRMKEAAQQPLATPHLGSATPPPDATLPRQDQPGAGYGTPAFTTPPGFSAPASSGALPGMPSLPTDGGVSPYGPGFVEPSASQPGSSFPSLTPPATGSSPFPSAFPTPSSGTPQPMRPSSLGPGPSNRDADVTYATTPGAGSNTEGTPGPR